MAKKKPLPEKELEQEPTQKSWSLTVGLYPGILFGARTYEEEDYNTHVFYLPFIDIAFEIEK